MVSKKEDKLKREFYSFQNKIDKLEEIKRELSALNTRGFEKEVNLIKSRLKDTSALPEIEKLMKQLRSKILNKKEVKKKSPLKKIQSGFLEIADTNLELKKEIANLKESINTKLDKKTRVDSGLNLTVDEGFHNFVDNIKLELAEKLKSKENELNNKLKQDIYLRRRELENKYKLMQENLKKEYDSKLNIGLKKEIEKKFEDELKKKFNEERSKIDLEYVSKIKNHYKSEFDEQKDLLEKEFNIRLKEELNKIYINQKKQKESEDKTIKNKIFEIEKEKKELELKLKKEEKDFTAEKFKQNEVLRNRINELELQKEKYNRDYYTKMNTLEKQKREELLQIEKFKQNLKKELAEKAHTEVASQIEIKRKKLNNELNNRFSEKVSSFIKEKNDKLQKELEKRSEKFNETLKHQQDLNNILTRDLSLKSIEIQKQKEINSKLNNELKNDLLLRKKQLEKNYNELKNRLEIEYHNKFDKELHKEITLKFKEELRKKFEEEKTQLDKEYVSKIKSHYEKEFNKKVNEKLNKLAFNQKRKEIDLSDKAHKQLTEEIVKEKNRLNSELSKRFSFKMNRFVEEQKKKYDDEIKSKTINFDNTLITQKRANDILNKNLSEKIYALEKQKERNRKIINEQSKLKHEEARKRSEEHKALIEQHKHDISVITGKLKASLHSRFDSEIRKHIAEEKQRLQQEFQNKKRDLSERIKSASIRDKIDLRKMLKQQYKENFEKSITLKTKKLQDQLRREFGHQANDEILLERKKLDNKLKEMHATYDAREANLKLREKKLLEIERINNLNLASEKKKFLNKLNVFKKEEKNKESEQRIKLQREFAQKAHQEAIQELKRREELIKLKFQREFEDRIKENLKMQEDQLTKKKAELASELQRKARAILS